MLKIYSETPNPLEEDLQKFLNKINEMESIVIASEFRNTTGRGGTIREVKELKNEETKQASVHHVCGKSHKKGSCDVVCKGCGMKGSHKEEKCWKLHPELKPKDMRNGREERDRGRQKERSRSKSREKDEEGKKRRRERSPYHRQTIRRLASGDREGTDRDLYSSQEYVSLKEAERELRRAQENWTRRKRKFQNKEE